MSELFGWMSKGGAQEVRKLAGIRPQRVEIQQVRAGIQPEKPLPVSPPAEAAAPRTEIHSTISFDLRSADYRIKSVLDPTTLVGEQFRVLRARLDLVQKQRGIKTLLVTSACPGEGKTFTACSLAGVLAREPGRRTLLLDCDLRKPQAGRAIGMKGESIQAQGLSNVLRGEVEITDVIASSPEGGFFFLPTGPVPTNPSELLSSPALESSLSTTKDLFDWVVLDAPPVLVLSDAAVLAPACDAILLVVRANLTPSKLVAEAVHRLGREKICGIVMNRARHLKSSQYYHDYHDKRGG
jgi:protein-tyrosine kinase